MTLQFRFRPAAIVAHIKSATLGALTSAAGMTAVVCLLSLLVPERPFWVELTAVALISAAVTFPLQFALHRRKKALRDLQKELQHALHHDPIIVTLCADAFATPVEHAIDRRRVSTAESPDGVILVVRVGNFDEIGRRYGPQWADTLLQSIAWIVHSSVRHGDLVARVASDEVGIYLPNATMENVNKICERIRARVYETTFIAGQERQIPVTVRFGGTRVGDQSAFQALSEAANSAALAEEEAGPLLFRELFS
ncbi:diguanylate cyclase (GGDEF) domain-containing protein [Rhizobium tibeticum]|uniref:Diguanylate cyclase (GGDEF) domain-containing protein n=1 Tax=Rhizobium tibeticum TaxID=501024 RepID=A0A1H8IYI1_9HYPH|nr:Diguanylate cyclase DosC [Rhizobium tibeticum]SEN73399.1 diguanylate cyclase (GGDEF) domain-containing protein [Rhizobium tibeticum]